MKRYLGTKVVHAGPHTEPQTGRPGYKVIYADGYASWSPKETFEAAYRAADGLTMGLAIEAMKQGMKVARAGWNGKGMWLALQVPDAHSKMSLPYVYMKTADDKKVPWLCSQTDLLAEDWTIIE